MANEHLKHAMQQAGLQPDDLADLLQVDVKTVRRWIYGARPYPRHRTRIARALDTAERELWPDLLPPTPLPTATAGQPPRSEEPVGDLPIEDHVEPDHLALIESARRRIDVVAAPDDEFLFTPGIIDALNHKAAAGCHIRVLCRELPDDQDRIGPAIELDSLEIHQDFSIHRYDDQMFITLRCADHNPIIYTVAVIHLTATSPSGTFGRLAQHLDALWRYHNTPTRITGTGIADDDDTVEADRAGADLPSDEDLPSVPPPTPPAGEPRRWPRSPPRET